MYIFPSVVQTLVMKNPTNTKFGCTTDERETYNPNNFSEKFEILGEPNNKKIRPRPSN